MMASFWKGCVCMLHVKHSENKILGKWHLKHDNRYFHAQLLHITDIRRCRSPPRPTRFRQKKIQLPCGQARQIIKLEASKSQWSDSAKPAASTTIDTCTSHIVTMSNKVLPKNKHESQALVTRRGESPPGPGVCFCACAHVCVSQWIKVPDEWQARQATPVILQVSSTYHHCIADITSRNHHPV